MHAYRTHTCAELRLADVGETVRLSGWVHRKRDHGHLLFVDLRDHYGITQIVADTDSPAFRTLDRIRVESVVTVEGEVVARSPDTVNPNLATGEIEVAVFEPNLFGIILLAEDRHRQFRGRRLNRHCARDDFDFTRGEVRVHRLFRAGDYLPFDRHHRFHANSIERLECGRLSIGNDLGDSVMIAQVDEQQVPVIALSMHPSRKPDRFADIAQTQGGAGMGTIGVHREMGPFSRKLWRKSRAALHWGKGFCQPANPPLKPPKTHAYSPTDYKVGRP